MVGWLTQIPQISLISWWVGNLTEADLVGGVAHTDPADLTDFVVGGKSHRGWWSGWLYGLSDYSEFSECSEYSECSIFSFY